MARKVSIEILPQASSDIRMQQEYYSLKSGEQLARKWMMSVKISISSLRQFPDRGAPTPFRRIPDHTLRRIPVNDFRQHLIFYEFLPEASIVRIVGVIHGARDVEPLIDGE